MAKQWVELKRGAIVDMSAVRAVNVGESAPGSVDNSRYLYVQFSGQKTPKTYTFDNGDATWAAYDKVFDALFPKDKDDDE